jgi:16S rRNA C967 or C1407 C5-methylase (RsmB/RsmF family)
VTNRRKPRPSKKRTKALNKRLLKEAIANSTPAISLGEIVGKAVEKFVDFYTASGLHLPETEWKHLVHSLRNPLPITFTAKTASEEVFSKLDAFSKQGVIERIGYLLNSYKVTVDQKTLKSDFPEFHEFLSNATDSGIISRQEIVSMLPVLLLKIRKSDILLDMCASPGSKTTQASSLAEIVVANELDYKRSHTLAKRAAAENVVIINHRAQTIPCPDCSFDKIICDVPCSGDGTFRKYIDKWAKYEPSVGRQLHSLQLQIGLRAARLLKVGGIMAYSTCSLNPIENEAVVQGILNATESCFEIVKSEGIKNFKFRAGLTHWNVVNDEREIISKERRKDDPKRYRASMFSEDREDLKNCMRVYPHDNDTGGFFIALLRKVSQWPKESSQVSLRPKDKNDLNGFKMTDSMKEYVTKGNGRYFNIVRAGIRR